MATDDGSYKGADRRTGDERRIDEEANPRITVALVGARVDEVKAIVQGHADATKAELKAIGWQLAALADLPSRMIRIEMRVDRMEDKDEDDAKSDKEDREYKRNHLPTLITSGIATAAAITAIVLQFT